MRAHTGADPPAVLEYIVIEFSEPSFIFLFALVRHNITSRYDIASASFLEIISAILRAIIIL
jgi:hypothetical protein